MLDNPNATVGNNSVGPNPGPNCGNWCIQGPVTDFRHSLDKGVTWHEERVVAKDSRDNLFGETAEDNSRVKFGAPHWVDFGQELEHSPDGKACKLHWQLQFPLLPPLLSSTYMLVYP